MMTYPASRRSILALAFLALWWSSGCQTAYYSTWEKFGKYKRDLLKDRVEEARDDQKKATEQFKDALTRLKEMYGFHGGDLDKTYDRLKSDYAFDDSPNGPHSPRCQNDGAQLDDLPLPSRFG